MPHGPVHAVIPAVAANHGPDGKFGGSGSLESPGCPDRKRVRSSSGPCPVIFLGVWQSLQPPRRTRYSPRLMSGVVLRSGFGEVPPSNKSITGTAASARNAKRVGFLMRDGLAFVPLLEPVQFAKPGR